MPLPLPFSIPYPPLPPPGSHSIYGPPTANTNFCELDHQFSPYIAELINTVSNLIYVVYAIHGLRSLRLRHRLTAQTALPHIGLMLVGIGSASFHATLLKVPQLADELGMAVPTGAVLARLLSYRFKDARVRKGVYGACILLVAGVYAVHCLTFSNWLHYPAFGLMVIVVGSECRNRMKLIADVEVRRRVRSEIRRGRVLFLGAFGLWLVDRFYCDWLIWARGLVGLPWGWLLELHGWWHVGTGMGAFVFIQVAEFLTEDEGRGDPGDRLNPFRLRLWGGDDGGVVGGHGNGTVKKGEKMK